MKALKIMAIIGIVLSSIGIVACWVNVISFQQTGYFLDMAFYGFFLALSIVAKIEA